MVEFTRDMDFLLLSVLITQDSSPVRLLSKSGFFGNIIFGKSLRALVASDSTKKLCQPSTAAVRLTFQHLIV